MKRTAARLGACLVALLLLGAVAPCAVARPHASSLHISNYLASQFFSYKAGLQARVRDRCGHADIRLLSTEDAGATWKLTGSVPGPTAQFVNSGLGLSGRLTCPGGPKCRVRLYRTTDGGAGWTKVSDFLLREVFQTDTGPYVQPQMITPMNGWMLALGQFFRTGSGGRTWKAVHVQCPKEAPVPQAGSFSSLQRGLVECEGEPFIGYSPKAIVRTTDGGHSWSLVSNNYRMKGRLPLPGLGYGTELDQVNARRVFLALDGNGLFTSTNGGKTFSRLYFTDDADSISSVSWPGDKLGYMTLGNGGLFRTRDRGAHWHEVPVGVSG